MLASYLSIDVITQRCLETDLPSVTVLITASSLTRSLWFLWFVIFPLRVVRVAACRPPAVPGSFVQYTFPGCLNYISDSAADTTNERHRC
jgi:hypothetical protein